jgi:hypothetical protein
MHIEYASGASESLVPAAKIDGSDSVLAKHGGAHDARLDGNIEVSLVEYADGVLGQNACNGDELGVSGAIESTVGLIHSPTDDLAVLHEDTTDRRLIAGQCKFGLSHVIGQLFDTKWCSRSAADARNGLPCQWLPA